MALEEYKRKRDFKITREPAPGKIVRHKQLSFLIQKHDATRLHYDFRLELDGVLLSWAVTKGPSYDPADKRLAVRTEDHPLSYGTFEGTIPKGQYGGGTVMLWDNGQWEPVGDPHEGLKKGNLKFLLKGQRMHGHWVLVRMHGHGKGDDKRENWLLIKEKDEEAKPNGAAADFLDKNSFSVTTGRKMDEIAVDAPAVKKKSVAAGKAAKPNKTDNRYAKDVEKLMKAYPDVELATLVDAAPTGEQWVHEIKFDGYRLLGFFSGTEIRLRTRNGNDWTEKFPSIRAAMSRLKCESAVIDMEAVVLDDAGKSSFQALQHALGEGGHPDQMIGYVFDLLYLDGDDLSGEKLIARKQKLEMLLKKSKDAKYLKYSDHVVGHGDDMIGKSCQLGLEGIICKKADAPYRAGRQKSWLKVKCIQRQEFVIIGFADPKKGERAFGALYLGYYKDDKLAYAGKVGTGFTMKDASEIRAKLEKIETTNAVLKRAEMTDVFGGEYGAIHWVKPSLLCEVQFTERTENGHIRHPSFQGLREDKKAKDVKLEVPEHLAAMEERRFSEKTLSPSGRGKREGSVAAKKKSSAGAKGKTPSPNPFPEGERVKKEKGDEPVYLGIRITHPERIVSKEGAVTKGQIAEYYAAAAPYMMPNLKRFPISLVRCPSGLDGEHFFQRNPGRGLGPDILPYHWDHNGKGYEYMYIEKDKAILELAQMGVIEIHPWGSTVDAIDYPKRVIFDLDPDPSVPFEAVKLAARDLRQRLKDRGLECFPKVTGGKGLHVIVPLAGSKTPWPAAKKWCEALADEMVEDVPDAYVATMTKAKRTGKIFIDFFRNDYTATAISDFGLRARPGCPVAVPLEWDELGKIKAGNQFTIPDVLKRLKKGGPDPERYTLKQKLPK